MKKILSLACLILITNFFAKAQCTLVVDSLTNLLCNNDCSIGKIVVSTTSGASPFSYTLMPGNITNTTGAFYNVCAGSYTITSTDATNCSTASAVTITSPLPLVSTETHTTSSCVPGCDGIINMTTNGGVPPYTFNSFPSIANSPSPGNYINVCQNAYTIQTIDANGCIVYNSFNNMSAIGAGFFPVYGPGNGGPVVNCNYGCTGSFIMGTPIPAAVSSVIITSYPSGFQLGNNIVGLCGMIDLSVTPYTIYTTMMDTFGCSASYALTYNVGLINATGGINLNANPTITNPTCATSCDGSIIPNPTGGLPPYTVSITGGLFNNLCNGTYTLSITDSLNCTKDSIIILQGPAQSTITINPTITNPTCATSCDGSIVPNPVSGLPPYTVSITSGLFNNLCNGTYTLSVTDLLNCTKDSIITLQGPAQIPIAINPIAPSICPNTSTTLSASGANTYTWQPGNMVNANVIVSPSVNTIYTVTAVGASGCSGTNSVAVTILPTPILSYSVLPSSTICFGQSITITASGASTYSWSNGINNGVPFVPANSGTYTVIASDSAGCNSIGNVSIILNPSTTSPNCTLTSSPYPLIIGSINNIIANIPLPITSYTIKWYVNNIFYSLSNSPSNTFSFSPLSLNENVYAKIIPSGNCFVPDTIVTNTLTASVFLTAEDINNTFTYSVFPNPASTEVYIDAEQSFTQYILYNQQMSVIDKQIFPPTKNKRIAITSLSNGIYFIKTNNGGMQKMIIQR